MKKLNLIRALIAVFVMIVVISACKKDSSYTQVSTFEKDIHDAINKYRVSIGKPAMVMQFLMQDNAQQYSTKMANGSQVFGTAGIVDELGTLATNLKADSYSVWVATCNYEVADSVMSNILKNAEIKTTIEGNYNQSAVGAVKNNTGTFYITHLLLHIP